MGSQNTSPTTFAFIDAANIMYGASHHGWKMDYEKLMAYLKAKYQPQKVLYFAGVNHNNMKQLKFYEVLGELGYSLRLIPVKTFPDGRKKADVDARLAFEATRLFPEFDRAVFLTGDGDFYWMLAYFLGESNHAVKGKDIHLLAFNKSTARELKQLFGGTFTDLSRLRHKLELVKTKKTR